MDIITNLVSTLSQFVFQLILKVFDIIFYPFIAILLALFPDISSLANGVLNFVSIYIVPYLKFFLSLLYNLTCLNPGLVSILVTYILFLVTAKYTMIAVNFALNVYQKLKP